MAALPLCRRVARIHWTGPSFLPSFLPSRPQCRSSALRRGGAARSLAAARYRASKSPPQLSASSFACIGNCGGANALICVRRSEADVKSKPPSPPMPPGLAIMKYSSLLSTEFQICPPILLSASFKRGDRVDRAPIVWRRNAAFRYRRLQIRTHDSLIASLPKGPVSTDITFCLNVASGDDKCPLPATAVWSHPSIHVTP